MFVLVRVTLYSVLLLLLLLLSLSCKVAAESIASLFHVRGKELKDLRGVGADRTAPGTRVKRAVKGEPAAEEALVWDGTLGPWYSQSYGRVG